MEPSKKNFQKNRGNEKVVAPSATFKNSNLLLIIGSILLVTLFIYIPSLHHDFLKTWDDQAYVTDNSLIKNLSFNSIKRMFKEDAGLYANYHPLTTLSLALNYHEGVSSFPFHLTSVILHLLNTLLVFVFIYFLTQKKVLVAGITSLWFGIHPMHVESVAWISERKDVLYTFFYLLALISYYIYVQRLKQAENLKNKGTQASFSTILPFSLTLLFFLFSSLSKAMAVSLPLVLLLMDYFLKRKFSLKILLEKIPFLAISIILGIYAMKVQAAGGATQGIVTFPFINKIFHASYGFTMYIVKLFAPVSLSAFYPYPYPLINSAWIVSTIPGIFYLTFLITISLIALALFSGLKGKSNQKPQAKTESTLKPAIAFGLGFYFVTIALVLQFFPVGRTIMSDRYSYIPYIGIFFLIGQLIYYFLNSSKSAYKQVGKLLVAVALVYTGFFVFRTINQIKVWKNDEALWSATIHNYRNQKDKVVLAYNNRASLYYSEKKYDEALNDYLTVATYDRKDTYVLEKIGRIYGQNKNDIDNAIIYFQKAYELNPKSSDALRGLSTSYGMKGQYAMALEFALKAIELEPNDPILYNNASMSYYFMGDQQKAAEFKAKSEQVK